ncbi:hypothetical protein B566_EDAN016836 [Ephemera danica]|nr:hypothetical protein B566_EDAN016836 [Ephemera danica]
MRKKVCSGAHLHSDVLPGYQAHPSYTTPPVKKEILNHVCVKCNKSFPYPRNLEKHLLGHKRNDCQQCTEVFASRKSLKLHMREKHNEKITDQYSCKFCEKVFTKSYLLYNHYHVHAQGQLVCEKCGEFFSNQKEYDSHIGKHEASRMSCILCHQTFARQQQYSMHMQSHEKYQCLTCKKGYPTKKMLLHHKQQGHKVQLPASFQCSFCNRTFYYKNALNKHQKQHMGEKTFKCHVCNKDFRTTSCQAAHFLTETHRALARKQASGDQGFVCEHCGKHFMHQRSLKLHRLRNHTVQKTFSCNFCSHSTNFKANLTRHIKLHLNERSYVCEQCGAAFYVLSALKDHCLYIHSDIRKHRCDLCSKSFKRSSELKRHQRTHSNLRPYGCTSCEKTFNRSSHLTRHREQCHKDEQVGKTTRQVQRLRQDKTGTFQPVPKEKVKSSKRKASVGKANSTQLVMLPYEEVVSFKHISDDEACRDLSTLGLECSQDLATAPAAHFLVTLPTQPLPSSDSNLIYITTTSIQSTISATHQQPEISKPALQFRETDSIELLKRDHYQNVSDTNSHMLLAPHEASVRNVLGADVKLSDSMMEDMVEPQQPSPGRDSPLCMSDLVRLQESALHDFRTQL